MAVMYVTNTSHQHVELHYVELTKGGDVRPRSVTVPHLGETVEVDVPDDQVASLREQCEIQGLGINERRPDNYERPAPVVKHYHDPADPSRPNAIPMEPDEVEEANRPHDVSRVVEDHIHPASSLRHNPARPEMPSEVINPPDDPTDVEEPDDNLTVPTRKPVVAQAVPLSSQGGHAPQPHRDDAHKMHEANKGAPGTHGTPKVDTSNPAAPKDMASRDPAAKDPHKPVVDFSKPTAPPPVGGLMPKPPEAQKPNAPEERIIARPLDKPKDAPQAKPADTKGKDKHR